MIKIYVAHPYGGKEENKLAVEKIIKKQISINPDRIFISPIHAFGYLYNDVDYDKGMEYCFGLLRTCDILLLCKGWQYSIGCIREKAFAELCGIQIIYYNEGDWHNDQLGECI